MRILTFVFVLCTVAVSASAQTTIAEAVDEAVQHNLSLLAERSSLTIAEAQMLGARLRPNPVLSLSADHLDLLGTGFDEANNGGPPELAMRVDMPLERGGKRNARMALASAVQSAAQARFLDAVRTLREDVTLACIDLIAAQTSRRLVGDTLRTYEEIARVNHLRVTAGAIAPLEATRSDVAMLQFRVSVVRADLEVATATAKLRTLLGRPAGTPVEISDTLDAGAPPPLPPDVPALESLAMATRADLRALQLNQAKSVADLRLQEALGRVDYTVGAEYRRQQGIAGKSNSLGVFFSSPLPFLSRNQGEIARAMAEREQIDRQLAARRAQIASEVQSAYHEYVTTRDLVDTIQRDLLEPAGRARDTSLYTYTAGGSTLLEVLDAQRAFNDTFQSYVDARASLRQATARLSAAVGTEVVK
jgi:cobalt-zinc-cadmium efflux system outer membrane protein